MKIKQAKFIISSPNLALCPDLNLPEFALLGRSNVGKSSFINALTRNGKLAKTSNKPGKTRLINLFQINEDFVIADLPGYGYAKVSQSTQAEWQKNLEQYLLKREALKSTIQFIDARHEIQKNDFQMNDWLKVNSVPVFAIMTKCDYISRNEVFTKTKKIEKYFGCKCLPFSVKNSMYNDEILKHIESLFWFWNFEEEYWSANRKV